MSREYEYAANIDKKIQGHLKSLGFNVNKPPTSMTIARKVSVLNYLRTIKTTTEVVGHAIDDIPTGAPE